MVNNTPCNQWAIHEIKRISDKHDIQCDYVTESAYIFTQEEKQLQKIEEVNAAAILASKHPLSIRYPLICLSKVQCASMIRPGFIL